MKISGFWLIALAGTWMATALARDAGGGIKETVRGAELQFEVNVDPQAKEVVVVPISEKKITTPPELRMKFLTKDAKQIPVKLKTISIPDASPRYAGKLDIWNDSYIGFEIQFRFGKTKWQRVRQEFSNPR